VIIIRISGIIRQTRFISGSGSFLLFFFGGALFASHGFTSLSVFLEARFGKFFGHESLSTAGAAIKVTSPFRCNDWGGHGSVLQRLVWCKWASKFVDGSAHTYLIK